MSDSVDLEKRVYALEQVLAEKFDAHGAKLDAHISDTKATIARDRVVLVAAVTGGLIILITILATTLIDRL